MTQHRLMAKRKKQPKKPRKFQFNGSNVDEWHGALIRCGLDFEDAANCISLDYTQALAYLRTADTDTVELKNVSNLKDEFGDVEDAITHRRDVADGWITEFKPSTGLVDINLEDGGSVEVWLDELLTNDEVEKYVDLRRLDLSAMVDYLQQEGYGDWSIELDLETGLVTIEEENDEES